MPVENIHSAIEWKNILLRLPRECHPSQILIGVIVFFISSSVFCFNFKIEIASILSNYSCYTLQRIKNTRISLYSYLQPFFFINFKNFIFAIFFFVVLVDFFFCPLQLETIKRVAFAKYYFSCFFGIVSVIYANGGTCTRQFPFVF